MVPPMLQHYDPTRGMISCFTNPDDSISAATADALRDLLVDHYQEAFRRLPVQDGVDLAQLADNGGLCLGLLDPVTNIILNTASLFLSDSAPEREALCDRTEFHHADDEPRLKRRKMSSGDERSRDSWHAIAVTSSEALLEFMTAYFGLLTEEQAGRYLVWARADLAMAVLLVEHDLYAARPALPDPRSGRTRNSLRLAATHAKHDSPDKLVSLATAWLPSERLHMLAPVLRHKGGTLTVKDMETILDVLRYQDDISAMKSMPPPPTLEEVVDRTSTSGVDLGDGRIVYTTIVQRAGDHIASLRSPQEMDTTLSLYSTHAALPIQDKTKWPPQDSPCASVGSVDDDTDACPYVRSLQMSLYGAIHGFYLRALAMLPSNTARQHVRGILLGGHCYGPMDPVSNIVLSAVWYDVNFPLPDADRRTQVHDILDTETMLRAMSRSLHGLVALLHATSGQKLPLHDILKYLCYMKCDLSTVLQPHLHHDGGSPNPFAAATVAARHPQASALAALFASLAPAKLDRLRSLMTSAAANNAPLSEESLTQLYNILREETSAMLIPPRCPKLSNTELSILARKRQDYDEQQSTIRDAIEQLLQEYMRGHPLEPKYDLDFICGVEITRQSRHVECYDVNFMAATKSSWRNTLFFAEISVPDDDQSRTSICCPLPQPYDMGRCYYGQESARMIVYPDHSVDYFSKDIIYGGLADTEGTLHMDFLYFDSERDVELAEELQKMAKQHEVRQRSSTATFSQWTRSHARC